MGEYRMKLLLMTLVLLEPFMEHASEWVPCKTSPSKYIMIKTVVNDKWVLGTYLTVSCNESMKWQMTSWCLCMQFPHHPHNISGPTDQMHKEQWMMYSGFFFSWQSFLIFQQRNWEEKNSNVNSTNFVSSLLSFAKISISKRVLIRNTGLDCLNCKIANLSKPALQPFPNFLLLINCYFRWAASHRTYGKTKLVAALSS